MTLIAPTYHPMSSKFIKDTYDPELGYEKDKPIHLQSNFGMGSDFGHADYVQAVNAGATPAEIKDWATRNSNQFINENAVGAGGLYDKIMSSSTPRGARPGIDNNPVNTAAGNWIGNSNTFDPNAKNYSIHRDIDVPEVNIPHPSDPYIPIGGGSGNPADQSYHPNDSPGDNPYISNYTPPQFGYMNDLSTLSPDELDYREGNIRGLDDRQNSIENPGALLNNYIFSIKEKLNKTPETKVGTIGKDQEVDNYQDRIFTSREGYESERDKERRLR